MAPTNDVEEEEEEEEDDGDVVVTVAGWEEVDEGAVSGAVFFTVLLKEDIT